ncbi:MAG TPA: MotA/TolQ/ExbB proton channel family protein [Solirubrobacterales bacterium]
MNVEQILFEVSEALRVPVLILALVALAVALVEAGALAMELWRRRGRSLWQLDHAIAECQGRLAAGMQAQAVAALLPIARNPAMEAVLSDLVAQRGTLDGEARVAKLLAEYDYRSLRKLERTRMLVRMGPALGLMGTLIPLSPALAGLADGDVATLTENLRVAFGVTVAGLLVGAVAFSISLVRDRLYAQDYSDVEYVAARLSSVPATNGAPVGHSHWGVAP